MKTALSRSGIEDYELILVANYVGGVQDNTPDVVKALAASDPRVRYSTRPKEGWMGWDMRCGLEMARGTCIGVIDGDGQMPVSDVPALYNLMQIEDYDLVKTFRITRGDGIYRRLISNVFNKVFHILFPGLPARDINSKPKLMSRAAYEKLDLESDNWFIDAEIMIQARRHGFRIGELPTAFAGLTFRRSFVRPAAILEFCWGFCRYRFRESIRQPD